MMSSPSAPREGGEDSVDLDRNGIPDHEELQTCCSGTSDRRFGVFLVQVAMTLGILVLCLLQIANTELDCESTQLYVSLLSLITGVWLKELKL